MTTFSDNYGLVIGGNTNNTINVLSGTFDGIFGGVVPGGSVHSNHIVIKGGTITGVVGGLTVWQSDGSFGDVSNNHVEIFGGTVDYVSGGEIAYRSDGSTVDTSNIFGNVYENHVVISGGTIRNGIVGGSALGGNASGNIIDIFGGTISGNVIGGQTQSGEATGNVITISGNPDVSDAVLWGGINANGFSYTGNTLKLGISNITAQNIDGFEKIDFQLNANYNPGTAALTLTEGTTNIYSLENIGVDIATDSPIKKDDTLNLIYNSDGGINIISSGSNEITMSKGGLREAPLALSFTGGNNITGTVGEFEQTDPAEIVPKSEKPVLEIINHSFVPDWLPPDDFGDSEEEGDSNSGSSSAAISPQNGFEAFTNTGGFRLKSKGANGAYSRTNAGNYDIGFARSLDMKTGKLIFAPVFEYGNGNYEVYLGNGTRGYGTSKYAAGGFIARKVNNSGFYFEASARGGRSKNNFISDDFKIAGQQTRATYNSSAPIFTGHVRLGHAKLLNKNNLLDIYGAYFYTRQGGTSAEIKYHTASGNSDHCDFSSVNSSRIKLGYRLTTRTSRISRIYTGLAYQYDRNSSAFSSLNDGSEIFNEGTHGSSGIIELGWQIKPNKNNPWLLDINATGWVGHQQGITAVAKMKKSF